MKKPLALILSLALVLSLAACGSSSSSTSEGNADASTSSSSSAGDADASTSTEDGTEDTNGDTTVDLTGMKVAMIVPISSVEALNQICENFVSYMGEYGVEAVTASMEGDNTLCPTLIENYVADDYDLIVIIPLDETGLEDSVTAAREAGTMVVMMSTEPSYEVDGGLTADLETCGAAAAAMGTYWVEQTFPDAETDSIGVAIVASETPENYLRCKEAMIDTVDACDATYTAYKSGDTDGGSIDSGYSFAESALTADPNIRLFITQECEAAKGINNYLISRSDLNLDEFCVVSVNTDETIAELVTLSETDSSQSVIRGLIPYGSDDTGRVAADIAYALLSGEEEAPYWMYDEIFTQNTFGWTIDMMS